MQPEEYFCLSLLWLVPISFGIWWVRSRLGYDKRWFVIPAAPLISRNFYFALPTVILGWAVGIFSLSFPSLDPNGILFFVAFFLWGISFIFAYLEPNWMAPPWYRWLKQEHGDILSDLAQEAHEMGRAEWLAQVQTQEDLERWVKEFRRKNRL